MRSFSFGRCERLFLWLRREASRFPLREASRLPSFPTGRPSLPVLVFNTLIRAKQAQSEGFFHLIDGFKSCSVEPANSRASSEARFTSPSRLLASPCEEPAASAGLFLPGRFCKRLSPRRKGAEPKAGRIDVSSNFRKGEAAAKASPAHVPERFHLRAFFSPHRPPRFGWLGGERRAVFSVIFARCSESRRPLQGFPRARRAQRRAAGGGPTRARRASPPFLTGAGAFR